MVKKPIRVLHVIGIMNRGGAENMIMNLYRNIDRERIQFDFVENSFESGAFDVEIRSLGGKIFRCPHFNGKNYFEYKKWWIDFWNKYHYEYKIVHGHIGSTASIYLGEAKKHGIVTIAHSHNTNQKKSMRQILYSILTYRTRYIADYFFACSNQAGIDRFGKKVADSLNTNYFVFRNAIDTSRFVFNDAMRQRIRNELQANEDVYILGHVGRFMEQKNHLFLLDIFKCFHELNPNSVLVLVGDGPLKEIIQNRIETLDLIDSVRILGVRPDVGDIMMGMDMLVFPSKYEGLPVTLVEAQTTGLPCVISDYVPDECILAEDLVTIRKLSDSPKIWADHIMSRLKEKRTDHQQIIIDKGFDVNATSKWLEEFYLEKGN